MEKVKVVLHEARPRNIFCMCQAEEMISNKKKNALFTGVKRTSLFV